MPFPELGRGVSWRVKQEWIRSKLFFICHSERILRANGNDARAKAFLVSPQGSFRMTEGGEGEAIKKNSPKAIFGFRAVLIK
jgi:hypothetical protein